MIIDISKSILFTKDPDERFASEYGLPLGVWREMYRRLIFLEYKIPELQEYFFITTKRQINHRGIKRWVTRTKIYSITSPVIKKGATHVNSQIFGTLEEVVLNELTKNMRFSGTKNLNVSL